MSGQERDMERVVGIGGHFIRAADPAALSTWHREMQDMEGVGRFGWVTDPEGNRIELWQPA